MKKNLSAIYKGILGAMLCLGLASCKDTFDIAPKDVLEHNQTYRDIYDADAAVIGIYGKFLGIARQHIILNELRADLLDVTARGDKYLREINDHSVSANNPYADPRLFYELILNCNDVLKNFDIMVSENKITRDQYNQRYSDIGAVRSWLYLQLGIQFGEIPYVIDPIENINDLKDASKFPKIGFDELLTKLAAFMESLPYKKDYATGSSLLISVDTYNTTKFFINKNLVMGDIYLWKGDYTNAATSYKAVLDSYPNDQSDQYFETYRVTYSNANDYVGGGNWYKIFGQPLNERFSNYENIWMLPFNKNFSPQNPFIDLFLTTANTNSYLLKPSAAAIKNWDGQMRGNVPGDLRGGYSWFTYNGQPIVAKYYYNYSPSLPFETTSKWILYRASAVHLRFAEAANRDGKSKLAFALLNNGIKNAYDPTPGVAGRDVTNIMQTLEPAPYNFDAREGEFPRFRGPWYRHTGIRSRMGLSPSAISPADSALFFNMTDPIAYNRTVKDQPKLTLYTEDRLVEEAGLELAYEGYRWPDLLRIALRREKENTGGGEFLYKAVARKFIQAGLPVPAGVTALKTDSQKWFLPFNW